MKTHEVVVTFLIEAESKEDAHKRVVNWVDGLYNIYPKGCSNIDVYLDQDIDDSEYEEACVRWLCKTS